MSCMAFETGETFSPSVKNPGSSATGLIQFMDATAKGMGTTTAALAKLTAEQQLDYVELHFKPYYKRINELSDMYMAILLPSAIGKAENAALFLPETKQYYANKGLDLDRDGVVSKREAAAKVTEKFFRGFQFSAPCEDVIPV